MACVGVLLAGGAARRFGGVPKGLCRIDGQRIADRVLAALAAVCDECVIVANDARAAEWFPAHRIVTDREPGMGPLAGLASAIRAGNGSAVLVVAWDMPFVTDGVLRALREAGERTGASVMPAHGAERTPEPLCAWYQPAALEVALALLAGGERRARALHDTLASTQRGIELPDQDIAPFGDAAHLFASVDTPLQLQALGGEPPALQARR